MDVRGVAAALSVALLSATVVGCGSADDRLRASTADDLHRQVDAVRQAVAAGREPAALTAVAELKATIRRLAGSGELDPADSVVLLTQADRIAAGVEDRVAPTPVPTPEPVPGPGDAEGDADEGKGKAGGKGEGKGKGKKK